MSAVVGRRVQIRGIVQGVGFRPFVYTLAAQLSLSGQVSNTGDGVIAEIQGRSEDVEAFCRRVVADAPSLAVVDEMSWTALAVRCLENGSRSDSIRSHAVKYGRQI